MGKRSKQARNRAGKPLKGPCYVENCPCRGGEKFVCKTCESLGKPPFEIQACALHRDGAEGEVRRHALVKHPANILRVMGAALKGEDVF